jgi:uncharacterized repeat protein (TIGR03803 family)
MVKNLARILSLAALVVALAFSTPSHAQYTENVLFDFDFADGDFPSSLIQDAAGNLYGVTITGGKKICNSAGGGCGVVFKLTNSGGTWTETILHAFTGGDDGFSPTGIALDSEGNIYGTANQGGVNLDGVAFKLSQDPGGIWKFTVLHSFPTGSQDGLLPSGAAIGPDGNFYAVTQIGGGTGCGGSGCGIVFELSPTATGQWKETVLHHFAGSPADGSDPFAPLIFDAAGNVYGVTGCAEGCGTAFKVAKSGTTWHETVLHQFAGGTGGDYPLDLVFNSAGDLFGLTLEGGNTKACKTTGCGTVFEIPASGGFSIIYDFTDSGDGYLPAALTIDGSGNLYGVATFADSDAEGSAFELSPDGTGWTFSTLYQFSNPTGGGAPTSVLLDPSGNLFGSTETGGYISSTSTGNGVVFELTP